MPFSLVLLVIIAMTLFFYKFNQFFNKNIYNKSAFMKHFSLFLKVTLPILFFSLNITAQERYKDEISDSVRVETYTYAFKDGQSLDLDAYFPAFDNQVIKTENKPCEYQTFNFCTE